MCAGQAHLGEDHRGVCDYAAKHRIPESQAIRAGMAHKAKEFRQSGSEIYQKA